MSNLNLSTNISDNNNSAQDPFKDTEANIPEYHIRTKDKVKAIAAATALYGMSVTSATTTGFKFINNYQNSTTGCQKVSSTLLSSGILLGSLGEGLAGTYFLRPGFNQKAAYADDDVSHTLLKGTFLSASGALMTTGAAFIVAGMDPNIDYSHSETGLFIGVGSVFLLAGASSASVLLIPEINDKRDSKAKLSIGINQVGFETKF